MQNRLDRPIEIGGPRRDGSKRVGVVATVVVLTAPFRGLPHTPGSAGGS